MSDGRGRAMAMVSDVVLQGRRKVFQIEPRSVRKLDVTTKNVSTACDETIDQSNHLKV